MGFGGTDRAYEEKPRNGHTVRLVAGITMVGMRRAAGDIVYQAYDIRHSQEWGRHEVELRFGEAEAQALVDQLAEQGVRAKEEPEIAKLREDHTSEAVLQNRRCKGISDRMDALKAELAKTDLAMEELRREHAYRMNSIDKIAERDADATRKLKVAVDMHQPALVRLQERIEALEADKQPSAEDTALYDLAKQLGEV